MHLMILHQNDGFALFSKFCLKTGIHIYEFLAYFSKLTTSEDLASSSVFIISMITFIIAQYLYVS